MMKILLCCGGGFSSSAIAVRMQKQIVEKGLENDYSFEFFPLGLTAKSAKEKLNQYDIVLCCPHLKLKVEQLGKLDIVKVPMYLLPPRIYGNMQIEDIIMDCEDIIHIYNETHNNPVCFKGEEKLMKIKRNVAHRKIEG